MSYAIMRIAKLKAGNISGCQKHNERENENYSNEDINKELTYRNYNLIECDSYKKAINKELDERYLSMRSIRTDAVLGVEVLFTSDNEFFENLTEEEEKKYFEKSLEFLKEFVGEENVISATVHKDESTPHMHCVFTPLTKDGRLHFKSFINGKNDLIKMQDNYYKKMSEVFPNLERGKSAKETKSKNVYFNDYKYLSAMEEKEKKLEEIKNELDNINNTYNDLEEKKIELINQQNNINLALENLKKNEEEVEEKIKKNLKEKEKLDKQETKLYYLNQIDEQKKEKKSLIGKEESIILSKESYQSLMTYAKETEKFLQENENLEEENSNLKFENRIKNKELNLLSNNYQKILSELNESLKTIKENNIEKNSYESIFEVFSEKVPEFKKTLTELKKETYKDELFRNELKESKEKISSFLVSKNGEKLRGDDLKELIKYQLLYNSQVDQYSLSFSEEKMKKLGIDKVINRNIDTFVDSKYKINTSVECLKKIKSELIEDNKKTFDVIKKLREEKNQLINANNELKKVPDFKNLSRLSEEKKLYSSNLKKIKSINKNIMFNVRNVKTTQIAILKINKNLSVQDFSISSALVRSINKYLNRQENNQNNYHHKKNNNMVFAGSNDSSRLTETDEELIKDLMNSNLSADEKQKILDERKSRLRGRGMGD